MNDQIKKVAAKARGKMTVLTTVEEIEWQKHQEFCDTFARLLIEECVNVIDGMRFTDEGPAEAARYQRTLCTVALKEYFGLQSKGPVSSRNIP